MKKKDYKESGILKFFFNPDEGQKKYCLTKDKFTTNKAYLVLTDEGWYEIVSEQEKDNMKSDTL